MANIYKILYIDDKYLAENGTRVKPSIESWQKKPVNIITIKSTDLKRTVGGLPFLRDLMDIALSYCKNDDDIILYANTDIGIISDDISFPCTNFFSVRKQIDQIRSYTKKQLEAMPFEYSVNCDLFGVTKKWYEENKNKIPDFLIGAPYWDICLVDIIKGVRLDNIIYHLNHSSKWKLNVNGKNNIYNRNLFCSYSKSQGIDLFKSQFIKRESFFEHYQKYGYNYLYKPTFLCFYTKSHESLYKNLIASFTKFFDNSYSFKSKSFEQICKTAYYQEDGWKKTQIEKISYAINEISSLNDNQTFIFCDADIIFQDNFAHEIETLLMTYDLVAQSSQSIDKNFPICSGFYAAKKTKKILYFLESVLNDLIETQNKKNLADQYFFNIHRSKLNYYILDETYYTPGFFTKGKTVETVNEMDEIISNLPKVKIIHFNWIKGVEKKLLFLNRYLSFKENTYREASNVRYFYKYESGKLIRYECVCGKKICECEKIN